MPPRGKQRRRRLLWLGLALAAVAVAAVAFFGVRAWFFDGSAPSRPELGEPPPRPASAPAPRKARVMVSTRPPGAAILLDGEPTNRRSPDFFLVTAERRHTLRLVLEGHEPTEVELRLSPGESREVSVELSPMPPE